MVVHKTKHSGYTIVETLIFLAVSSFLLVAAIITIGGRQGSTQFSQGIRQVQSEIDEVMNDVATGYYQRDGDINCSIGGSGPSAGPGGNSIGTNVGCVFLGRVIHFSPDVLPDGYSVYSVVGRQFKDGILSELATSYTDAQPSLIGGNQSDVNYAEGISLHSMTYDNGGADVAVGAVGFFARLDQYNEQFSGGQTVSVIALDGTQLNDPRGDIESTVNSGAYPAATINSPVKLCLNSGTSNQHGIITIGDVGGRLSTELVINNGACT